VHDLVPLRFPQWVTPKTAAMHAAKYADTARSADLVFVNSEYTGRDVVDRLGVRPEFSNRICRLRPAGPQHSHPGSGRRAAHRSRALSPVRLLIHRQRPRHRRTKKW